MLQRTAKRTSKRSFWSFGPALSNHLYTVILSFYAEASNIILVLFVSLSVLTTGKCAKEVPSFVVSDVSCCHILLNGFLISFTHFFTIFFSLHHCNYLINKCLDISSVEYLSILCHLSTISADWDFSCP